MKTRWLAASVLAACLGTEGDSVAGSSVGPAVAVAASTSSAPSSQTAIATPATSPATQATAAAAAFRVVIDPGHGGTNTGARGAEDGVLEKRVTLAVAKQLAAELRAAGLEVSLTRQVDRTLTLRQRAVVANREGADLFVSVHANASPTRSQRGFETYVLTPAGVDVIAPALRNEEPSPRPGVAPAISGILDDIERGSTQWEAADLAAAVQTSLRAVRGRDHDRGVRQDAHHVLLGATMPAVLVEIGFVDHPIEGRELIEPATQTDIAKAIASAVVAQAAQHQSGAR